MSEDPISKAAEKWIQAGLAETDSRRKMHYFNMALDIQPHNVKALNYKGIHYHQLEQYHDAIRCYDTILRGGRVSNPSPVQYNKAITLRKIGEYDVALVLIIRVLKHDSENEQALKAKKELENLLNQQEQSFSSGITSMSESRGADTMYAEWDPPAISTLVSRIHYADWGTYKRQRSFGVDDIKEGVVRDKLESRAYCCGSCDHSLQGVCRHGKTRGMRFSERAICKRFRPHKRR